MICNVTSNIAECSIVSPKSIQSWWVLYLSKYFETKFWLAKYWLQSNTGSWPVCWCQMAIFDNSWATINWKGGPFKISLLIIFTCPQWFPWSRFVSMMFWTASIFYHWVSVLFASDPLSLTDYSRTQRLWGKVLFATIRLTSLIHCQEWLLFVELSPENLWVLSPFLLLQFLSPS